MGGGGKQSLLPYLGGVRKVLLWIWERRGGGGKQKSLKVDIISFGVFKILPEPVKETDEQVQRKLGFSRRAAIKSKMPALDVVVRADGLHEDTPR